MWMLFVLNYGVLKGTREIVKKKSLQRSSVMEVLFFYTLFAFLFVCPDVKNAAQMDMHFLPAVAFKSFIIFLAWMCSFKAIKKMPISLYGLLDLSRVLFATLLAVIVQHEVLSGNQMIGLLLVCVGLLMLKRPKWPMVCRMQKKVREKSDIQTDDGTACTISEKQKNKEQQNEEHGPVILVLFALASCMLNAISGLLDKILTKDITSAQLQFWYMLFLVLYYLIYIIIAKEKIHVKESLKNPWIWLLAILFVIADRSLFLANANPESRISIMTLIKQSGCIVTILAGKFIFHEKNIGYKLICAAVIIAGIVVAVL